MNIQFHPTDKSDLQDRPTSPTDKPDRQARPTRPTDKPDRQDRPKLYGRDAARPLRATSLYDNKRKKEPTKVRETAVLLVPDH